VDKSKVKTTNNPTYCTDHLYLAAYLVCCGHPALGTRGDGRRVEFVFSQTPQLSADAARFMADGAVAARQFSFEILKLKRLIPRSPRHEEQVKRDMHETTRGGT
jgi:hypothetical protein